MFQICYSVFMRILKIIFHVFEIGKALTELYDFAVYSFNCILQCI